MAEIKVERKRSPWAWIIAILVIALLIWFLLELFDNDDENLDALAPPVATAPVVENPPLPPATAPAATPVRAAAMPPPPTEADNGAIPVATIVIGPVQFLGQPVAGVARVAEVPSDRGFWLEQDGQRMFAVIARGPGMEDAINVNPGQEVRLAGVVYDASMADQITEGLDPQTTATIADQPAFLLVDARNILIVDRAGAEPAADATTEPPAEPTGP